MNRISEFYTKDGEPSSNGNGTHAEPIACAEARRVLERELTRVWSAILRAYRQESFYHTQPAAFQSDTGKQFVREVRRAYGGGGDRELQRAYNTYCWALMESQPGARVERSNVRDGQPVVHVSVTPTPIVVHVAAPQVTVENRVHPAAVTLQLPPPKRRVVRLDTPRGRVSGEIEE